MFKSKQPKILFVLTGSIACFKACALLSKLKQRNYDIQVVATASALEFIGEATLEGLTGKPVVTNLFGRGQMMDHIHLDRWADLILVCPATAHYINRVSQGVGDDLATTLFLAHDFKKPFLVAPAMNSKMYLHPATQASVKKLQEWGIDILESASGVLACGETGFGRLLEPEQLLEEVEKHLYKTVDNLKPQPQSQPQAQSSKPLRALVTAGGTYEPLDAVRVLTNLSTGQTGQRIASYFSELGFSVDLLLSELSSLKSDTAVENIERFSTFRSLQTLMHKKLQGGFYDVIIHAAAVSDYHVSEINGDEQIGGKLPSGETLTLKLKPNPKIINEIKKLSPHSMLIGFKLTSGLSEEAQKAKVLQLLEDSHADYVVSNDLTDVLHKSQGHGFRLYSRSGNVTPAENTLQLNQKLSEELTRNVLEQRGL